MVYSQPTEIEGEKPSSNTAKPLETLNPMMDEEQSNYCRLQLNLVFHPEYEGMILSSMQEGKHGPEHYQFSWILSKGEICQV